MSGSKQGRRCGCRGRVRIGSSGGWVGTERGWEGWRGSGQGRGRRGPGCSGWAGSTGWVGEKVGVRGSGSGGWGTLPRCTRLRSAALADALGNISGLEASILVPLLKLAVFALEAFEHIAEHNEVGKESCCGGICCPSTILRVGELKEFVGNVEDLRLADKGIRQSFVASEFSLFLLDALKQVD